MLPMTLRHDMRIRVEVPWPNHPTVTAKRGQPSKAKSAGKPIPWLSANAQHNLQSGRPGVPAGPSGRIRVHGYKVQWGAAAMAAVQTDDDRLDDIQLEHQVEVEIRIYRNRTNVMDPAAIVEGAKPLIDGLVKAGLLVDDGPEHLVYSRKSRIYPCPKGEQRVELVLRRPQW